MPNREPQQKEQTEIERQRRWSAAIEKALESFKCEGTIKVTKAA